MTPPPARRRPHWTSMEKILLVKPPHTAIGSRIPREQLPPLGLLSVGGPLIDAGYDVAKWDYKHQVLATTRVPPWRVLLWVKAIEVIMQARPRAIMRVLLGKDRHLRHAMRWYTRMGRRVWMHEIAEFILRKPRADGKLTLRSFWGGSLAAHEESMVKHKRPAIAITAVKTKTDLAKN